MTAEIDGGRMGASRLRLAGVGIGVAVLLALAPARADAGSMYVHSADSGELAGGRLTLHGVGRNVTWTSSNGRAGVARIKRAHNRLFLPKRPATGTLHVAGQRGGEELAFRLSRPRYSTARRTVSYRARPLVKRSGTASAATAAPRRFGAASLSVVPHASVGSGDNGGNDCEGEFTNRTWYGMALVSSAKWDTDDWEIPLDDFLVVGSINIRSPGHGSTTHLDFGADWKSDGGLWRGCANHTTWKLVTDPQDPTISGVPPANVTIDFNVEWDWSTFPAQYACAVTDPRFTCEYDRGEQEWELRDTQRPPG